MTDAVMNEEAMPEDASAGPMPDEELRRLLDGRLNEAVDPALVLASMPDAELSRLADGLYRHLDTPSPAFGARFWYVQVTEELRLRHLGSYQSAAIVPAPSMRLTRWRARSRPGRCGCLNCPFALGGDYDGGGCFAPFRCQRVRCHCAACQKIRPRAPTSPAKRICGANVIHM